MNARNFIRRGITALAMVLGAASQAQAANVAFWSD